MDRNETYAGDGIHNIRLKLTWAQLEVTPSGGGDVRLMIAGDDESVQELRIEQDGSYLRVAQPQLKYAREILPRHRWLQIGLMLPERWPGSLDADTIAGTVGVRSVRAGEVAVSTVSAGMNVRQVEAKTTTLHTVAGHISAADITAGSMNLRTISGDITVTGAALEKTKVSTVSGGVSLELKPGARQLDIQSISGAACVWVEEAVRAQLHSLGGQFRLDGGVENADGGLEISASSVSGDLSVKRKEAK